MVFAYQPAWAWTLLAFRLPTPESVMQIGMTVLFPLTFASNVFVDPAHDARLGAGVVEVNPISHLARRPRGPHARRRRWQRRRLGAGVERRLLAVFAPMTMRRYNNEG